MAKPPGHTLIRVLKERRIQELLTHHSTSKDLSSCRLVCRDLAIQLAPLLFADITVLFRSCTLTRPSRLSALERVGHNIQTVTFEIPHAVETFLPPVIDSITGTEQTFAYTPQRHGTSLESTRYGSMEMTGLLVSSSIRPCSMQPSPLHAYMQSSPGLERLIFHWKGERGLSPLSLATEPCLQISPRVASTQYGRQRAGPSLRPLKFHALQQVELVNATMDASQIASFTVDHRHSLPRLQFSIHRLANRLLGRCASSTNPAQRQRSMERQQKNESTVDVPIVLSPSGVSRQQLQ